MVSATLNRLWWYINLGRVSFQQLFVKSSLIAHANFSCADSDYSQTQSIHHYSIALSLSTALTNSSFTIPGDLHIESNQSTGKSILWWNDFINLIYCHCIWCWFWSTCYFCCCRFFLGILGEIPDSLWFFFFSSSLFPFLVIFIFERFCSWVISTRLRLPAQMVGKCSHQKSIPEKEGKKVMNKVRNGKKEIRRRRRRKTDIKTRWRS